MRGNKGRREGGREGETEGGRVRSINSKFQLYRGLVLVLRK